ncbi:unnamed protein product [Mytilus edulis]|uniref:DUF4371 domain-containing protein n=1 Tax=Mytilus edulis TaxID=6550 RepID=A0A8S3VKM2_MYTED|nr:unnamed protein product [Mytilus edulis]
MTILIQKKTTPDISSPIQSEPDPEISETTEPSTSKKSTPMSVSSQKGLDPAIFLIENQHSTDVQKLAMLKDADKISKEVDAEHIANAIVNNLEKWGLPLQKLRGQGYDGASVMSGHVSGVQQCIREPSPDAPFVHCKSHNLNLVVTQSCKDVRQIRNLMSSVGQMTWFLCASHKRKTILNSFTGNTKLVDDMLEGLHIKLLKKGTDVSVKRLCETRWTARVDTVSSLLANYKSVHAALTKIENVSTSDARTNASGYRCYLEDPECIVAVLVAQFVLSILKPLTLFLQKTDCNMVDVFEESKILLELLQEKRTEEIFSELFRRGTVIADAIEIDLMPRRGVKFIGRTQQLPLLQSSIGELIYFSHFWITSLVKCNAGFLMR